MSLLKIIKSLTLIGVVIISAAALSQNTEPEPLPHTTMDYLQGLNNPIYEPFHSSTLDRSLHIYVRLPEGYAETDTQYPVVYLLDGGATFPMLGGYYNYLRAAGDVPDMIIVGLSYGSNDFRTGNMRSTDYTAPAEDRDHYGGASKFQHFLSDELFPALEAKYRINNKRRILFGQSIGGQFVLYTALTKPDLFWGHLASNPALHRNLPFFLDHPVANAPSNSKLFVSIGENDDKRFKEPSTKWVTAWRNKQNLPWEMTAVELKGENHFSAATSAFRQGIKWFFEKP